MGTRGYIVIKFQNKYYRIYNHWDSYPDGLGVNVVNAVKTRKIEKTKECVDYIINKFLTNQDNLDITEDVRYIVNDVFIEWVYIIDIDNDTFSFTGGKYNPVYCLNEIPDDWLEKFNTINNFLSLDNYKQFINTNE